MNDARTAQPIAVVAKLIGVTERTIRNWVAERTDRPWLETQGEGSLVVPAEAYEYGKKYSPRSRGLKPPPGHDTEPTAGVCKTKSGLVVEQKIMDALDGRDPNEFEPDDLNYRLSLAGIEVERCRAITQAVRAMQNKKSIDLRAGKTFTSDETVDMLRGYGKLFVDEVDAGATAYATKLLAWIRKDLGADLAEKNAAALQLLENHFREEFGNDLLSKLRGRVEDTVNGVKALEFAPVEASK